MELDGRTAAQSAESVAGPALGGTVFGTRAPQLGFVAALLGVVAPQLGFVAALLGVLAPLLGFVAEPFGSLKELFGCAAFVFVLGSVAQLPDGAAHVHVQRFRA